MCFKDLRTHSRIEASPSSDVDVEPKPQVYPLPPHLLLPAATISQCRWSAYSSELLLYKLLVEPSSTSSIPSSLVTTDPSEADLFLIPLFSACYIFNCWVKAGWKQKERCGVDEEYIFPVMNWVKEQGYWNERGGRDHIIFHPMDFIDGYFKPETRAAMNSSIYLVTVGDLRPPPYSQHFPRFRSLVIPSATHLINSYFVNPMDYLDLEGHPRATPPTLATLLKLTPTFPEIWEPSAGLEISSGWRDKSFSFFNRRGSKAVIQEAPRTIRKNTAIFRGGIGQPNEGESYSLGIRNLFFPSSSYPPSTSLPHLTHPGFSSLPHYDIAESSTNEEYALALSHARFGLVPPGYTLDTTRIWEYLAFGVVPVFLGTGPRGGQVMPFSDDFDYESFSIFIPRENVHLLETILDDVSAVEYEKKRSAVWKTGRRLVLEGRKGEVWNWIARGLCRISAVGMVAGPGIYYS